jgi:hypothetical protein
MVMHRELTSSFKHQYLPTILLRVVDDELMSPTLSYFTFRTFVNVG